MAGKCLAFLCVVWAVCGAQAPARDEMAPGIRARVVASDYPERRRAVRVPVSTPHNTVPISFTPDSTDQSFSFPEPRNQGRPASAGLGSSGTNVNLDDRTHPTSPDHKPSDVVGGGTSPLDLNMDETNMNAMRAMSQIRTVEEFARLMGVDLPRDSGVLPSRGSSNFSITARFGLSDQGASVPPNAGCTPEIQTVRLEQLEPQLNIVYFPTCVRLPRCGGCCAGHALACKPIEVKPIKLKILRVEQDLQSGRSADEEILEGRSRHRRPRPENTRRRRGTSSSYVTVEEEEHTACSCQCRVQEQDCNPLTHDYNQRDCQCACKNNDEMSKCGQRSLTHLWDGDDCACYCLYPDNCSTGHYFDHNTCSCLSLHASGRSGASLAPLSDDSSRRPPERAPVVFAPTWGINDFDTRQPQLTPWYTHPSTSNFHRGR